jgi:hypothetical protein
MGKQDRASKSSHPARAESDLLQAWQRSPERSFDLIVRVEGDPSERGAQLKARGVEVRRRYRLTPTLSIRCAGRAALALLDLEWIVRIEPDKQVSALGGDAAGR